MCLARQAVLPLYYVDPLHPACVLHRAPHSLRMRQSMLATLDVRQQSASCVCEGCNDRVACYGHSVSATAQLFDAPLLTAQLAAPPLTFHSLDLLVEPPFSCASRCKSHKAH